MFFFYHAPWGKNCKFFKEPEDKKTVNILPLLENKQKAPLHKKGTNHLKRLHGQIPP